MWSRRLRWPILAAALVVVSGFFARAPLLDAVTRQPVDDVALTLSPGYLALAPLGALLDQLSLLTDRQHVAVLVSVLLLLAAWRIHSLLRPARARRRLTRLVVRQVAVGGAGFGSIVGLYGFGVLGVRPMAAIQPGDPDMVVVDFHSHTEASHDGRSGLDERVRREWHRGAGFDLVYVTDHSAVGPAMEAVERNPDRAGDGISLLPGLEVVFRQQHVIVLEPIDPNEGIGPDRPWPTLIQTIPNDLSRVPIPDHGRRGGVHAIELIDGDPRALRQSIEERDHILALADSLDLALIAGSNHHGWGRAAAGWSLVRIPGWRGMPPAEVGRLVEAQIRRGAASEARVVERARLAGGTTLEHPAMAATSLPRLMWHVLAGLTLQERIAWLAWIAAAALIIHLRAPRPRPGEVPGRSRAAAAGS